MMCLYLVLTLHLGHRLDLSILNFFRLLFFSGLVTRDRARVEQF